MSTPQLPPVPFHSQHWDLSKWHELGFQDYEDAEYWMWSSCGILCIQMAAEYYLHRTFRTDNLITRGKELRAYSHKDGWSHSGLVELIQSLGLHAKSGSFTPYQLADELEKGHLAMVSIKVGFEPKKNVRERVLFWKKYGGHLALVIDDKQTKHGLEGFYLHHTSARKELNWEGTFVDIKRFTAGYTGRAIIISK